MIYEINSIQRVFKSSGTRASFWRVFARLVWQGFSRLLGEHFWKVLTRRQEEQISYEVEATEGPESPDLARKLWAKDAYSNSWDRETRLQEQIDSHGELLIGIIQELDSELQDKDQMLAQLHQEKHEK